MRVAPKAGSLKSADVTSAAADRADLLILSRCSRAHLKTARVIYRLFPASHAIAARPPYSAAGSSACLRHTPR
jgi:hypothetical protein